MDNDSRITETVVYLYTYSGDNHLVSVAGRAKLEYSGKIQTQQWPALFRNFQSFVDLESIQHKLLSDYSLTVDFSCRFPHIDGLSFSPYKPSQNVHF